MLSTSTTQYLHPEYLQPLPTTLDAKKSPLALLAQTCSSIGKDPSPSKPLIPSISKKDSDKPQEKHRDSPEHKRPESNSNKNSGRDSVDKPGFRTVPSKDIPPLVPIPSSSVSPSSHSEKTKSPQLTRDSKSSEAFGTSATSSRPGSQSISVTSSGTTNTVSSARASSSHRESDNTRESTSAISASKSTGRSSADHISYITKPGNFPSLPGLPGLQSYPPSYQGFPFMPHGLPLDPSPLSSQGLAANAAAMAAAQNNALKHASASAMSPYVTYARVRTPSGATTLVPVCRDPYCSNCQLTVQTSHLSSTCNAPGCPQCAHEKSLQSLSGYGLPSAASLSLLQGSAGYLSSASTGLPGFPSLSSLYPPSALSAHQGLPFVCNWVSSGNDYCGKRFGTSDELLQHLRTHTSASDSSAAALAAAYGGLGGLSALHGHLPNAGNISPNSLRRAYPTSLSPVSGMLGSSRYHPYKSPLTSAPSVLPPPGQPLPSYGPYYSPYALYGQRLGAAAVP